MTKFDTADPYLASYIIFRKDSKIACLLRSNTKWMDNHYGLVAGKVEKNESAVDGAIREAKEEAGVDIKPADLKPVLTAHRHADDTDWIDLVFEAQAWSGELHNAEPHMHSDLTWLDPDSLPENMVPSVRYYIEQVQAGNHYCQYGWDKP